MRAAKVLLLDIDPHAWGHVAHALREEGMEVEHGGGGEDRAAPYERVFDVAIVDSKSVGGPNGPTIEELLRLSPGAAVIVASDDSRVEAAVSAIRKGAFDCLVPPFDPPKVVSAVSKAWKSVASERISGVLETTVVGRYDFEQYVGESAAAANVRARLQRVASGPSSSVLITGEAGVGKSLAARLIHFNSRRSRAPFIALPLVGLSPVAIEGRLFGSVRGRLGPEAVPGILTRAHGGTVVLDDVDALPASLVGKLIQFLEDGRYLELGGSQCKHADVRIIATTRADLSRRVSAGLFSSELYFRLRVLTVAISPLRARIQDVRSLVSHTQSRCNREMGTKVWAVARPTLEKLMRSSWPGNVAQLVNSVEAAVLRRRTDSLLPEDFPGVEEDLPNDLGLSLPVQGIDLEAMEKRFVIEALKRTGGNRTRAAELLGLNRDQMRYRVDKYGLRDWPFPPDRGESVGSRP